MTRRYQLTASAKLFFWPAEDGSEEEAVYPTLKDALRAASEGDAESAWIITEAGDILNPRMIKLMRDDLLAPAQRRTGFSLLGWARAA